MSEILEGPEAIAIAVALLERSMPVVFPTETVYGLGAPALDPGAVARVFELKGRPSSNPLIVHVSGPEMAQGLVRGWSEEAQRLSEAFWPGAVTMVLEKDPGVPDIVTAGGPTVALRCPGHPVALALIEAFGAPIVGPSANRSGRISPTTAQHAADAFSDEDVLVIDGGSCRAGIESTVVDLSSLGEGGVARVLRPGIVGVDEIARVLGREVVVGGSVGGPDGGVRSPGLLGAHYQPRTRTVLKETGEIERAGAGVFVLTWSGARAPNSGGYAALGSAPEDFARGMYAALHDADASGCEEIWVERVPDSVDPVWEAVRERLGRACS